jgi:hypothetical protein
MANVDTLIEQYPAFAPLFHGVPEIRDMVNSLPSGFTANTFIGHLMGTNWWKTHSTTQRDWIGLQLGNPAEATRQSNNQALKVLELASSMGVGMTLERAGRIADLSLSEGWDASRMQYEIGRRAEEGTTTAGTLQGTQTSLRAIASQQGINVSDHTTFDWAKKISSGMADQKGYETYVKDVARWMHPYWEKQINEGATVRQLADPYVQQAAQTLEISPDQVDLSDPKWNFAQRDKAGNQTPMSQLDWSRKLMSDPSYGYDKTNGARTAAYQMVDQLRKSFGAS